MPLVSAVEAPQVDHLPVLREKGVRVAARRLALADDLALVVDRTGTAPFPAEGAKVRRLPASPEEGARSGTAITDLISVPIPIG